MEATQKRTLLRIAAGAVLLLAAALVPGLPGWLKFLPPCLLLGGDVLWDAVKNLFQGHVLDEHFLMATAAVGAFAIQAYGEAAMVLLLYQVGELFQDCAVDRSRQSIETLMDIRPDLAHLEQDDGTTEDADPNQVPVGSVILVKPGERIPLDGTVLSGRSALDTAALTGESMPRAVEVGDRVLSGCVNQTGPLRVRTTALCSASTASKILELVEEAGEKKSASEKFITRFAKVYTPCVVGAAALLFLIPTLALAFLPTVPAFLAGSTWADWLRRALTFLVISCPCALVISVPLSFFGAVGGAAKRGILVKGGVYLDALAKTETVVFDKTGTLTEGQFSVSSVQTAADFSEPELLRRAALAERYSSHPLAQSLRRAAPEADGSAEILEELPGLGVRAVIDGQETLVGSVNLLNRYKISVPEIRESGAAICVAVAGQYAGTILLKDRPKAGAGKAIQSLRKQGVRRLVLLTGDRKAAAQETAAALKLDDVRAELLPADKIHATEALLEETHGGTLVFVGDGVNDAPSLARADIGVAMGALGSDAAIEAADVVLMDDDPEKLPEAVALARRTLRIVRQNIVFTLAVKVLVMVLGALGHAALWAAAFADVGVAALAVLNAMRCMYVPRSSTPKASASLLTGPRDAVLS